MMLPNYCNYWGNLSQLWSFLWPFLAVEVANPPIGWLCLWSHEPMNGNAAPLRWILADARYVLGMSCNLSCLVSISLTSSRGSRGRRGRIGEKGSLVPDTRFLERLRNVLDPPWCIPSSFYDFRVGRLHTSDIKPSDLHQVPCQKSCRKKSTCKRRPGQPVPSSSGGMSDCHFYVVCV